MFGLSTLAVKAIGIGLVIAAIVGGFLYLKTHYYNQGYAAAVQAIAAQDQRAINARDEALAKVRACRNRGGTWDVVDGMCREPAR